MEAQKNQDKDEEFLKLYFQNLSIWYNNKYIKPYSHKSYAICTLIYSTVILFLIAFQTYKLFPLTKQIKYIVQLDQKDQSGNLSIINSKNKKDDYTQFFAKYLLKNYVKQREVYDYANLRNQLLFVKTKSTPQVFNQFYSFLQIDNPTSPVLRYQDQVKRLIQDISVQLSSKNIATVRFDSIVYDLQGQLMEHLLWEATVNFEISAALAQNNDPQNLHFIVMDYKLKILENKIQNDVKKS